MLTKVTSRDHVLDQVHKLLVTEDINLAASDVKRRKDRKVETNHQSFGDVL